MKTILENRSTRPRLALLAWLTLLAGSCASFAGKLDPADWKIYDCGGPSAGKWTKGESAPPAANLLTNLADNNLSTFTTLDSPSVLVVDMGRTNVLHRVYVIGSKKPAYLWANYQGAAANRSAEFIAVYVGDTPDTTHQVAQFRVPYDGGDPVETEVDARFSPAAGRYVRLELSKAAGHRWNVGELELYGFGGAAATETHVNAVVLPPKAASPLALAAGDLSYYLGELTGSPHPIISPGDARQYSGTLYTIVDLKPQAPDYSTMMKNIAAGLLPNNVNVEAQGRQVLFKAWPYRCVLWSVWEFLERQGVRWVFPDGHGDFVPAGKGVDLSLLPLRFTPSAVSIYANFDCGTFQPFSFREPSISGYGYLYPWRNRWNGSWNYGPLEAFETPRMPLPGRTVKSDYTEAFVGYPHNFGSVVPNRILKSHTNWWGWATTNAGSAVNPESRGAPTFAMDEPTLISWVADKLVDVAAAFPLACGRPLNINHRDGAFSLLPMDSAVYSKDPYTMASNGPVVPNPVPWVNGGDISYSGMYYSFVTSVARLARQKGSDAPVGALAYADVFLPPTNIPALTSFPTNVRMEVCLYGAPNLPMSSPANAGEKAALDGWHAACSHLTTYDYALLHIDYWQKDPRLPVPLIAGTVDRAKYLASVGALDGGCQAELASLRYNPWNFYAYPRIRWNVHQTAAQLEQEFFTGYYCEAAAPMLAYYQAMENYQVSNNVSMYYMGYAYGMTPCSFPLCVLAAMQTNLAQARALATNWWVAARVADAAAGFDWVVEHSPQGLKPGQDFSDTSSYPVLDPTATPMAINLKGMVTPACGMRGNSASARDSGAKAEWVLASTNWYSESWIQRTYNVTAGTYRVDVSARSGAPPGYWPTLDVYLGPASGSAGVESTTDSTYSFKFTVPAGTWDLVLRDVNAWRGAARDLMVDGLRITRQ